MLCNVNQAHGTVYNALRVAFIVKGISRAAFFIFIAIAAA